MRCDYCHGKGTVLAEGRPLPCSECGGTGILHCCEGLQVQPGPDEGGCERGSPTETRKGASVNPERTAG